MIRPEPAPVEKASKAKAITSFFLVAVVLYVPLALFAQAEVFPNVSLFNFAAFLPATAALILVYREHKMAGVKALLKRSFDCNRIASRVWLLPAFLLYPAIVLVQYGLALLSGWPVPSPHFTPWLPAVFIVLFVAALGEELGWMGYVFEPMQERWGALGAGLLLGVLWALFHIPLFAAGGAAPLWILWQGIYIVTTRVLLVWIYNNAGKSLFAVITAHATFNMGWRFFPPSGGLLVPSFYDPRRLALTAMALAAAVVFLWGPKTLARYRYAHAGHGA